MLAPVSFSMVNADGKGDYFDGLAADCQAADDIGHDLGDVDEASLAEALGYRPHRRLLGGGANLGPRSACRGAGAAGSDRLGVDRERPLGD